MNAFFKKWNGKQLQDCGSYVSKEFISFQTAFRNEVKRICAEIGAELVAFRGGHYDMSGFICRNGHFVYFCYSNYRNRTKVDLTSRQAFYCRTAANENDYRGGINNNVPFTDAKETFDRLLNTEHRRPW